LAAASLGQEHQNFWGCFHHQLQYHPLGVWAQVLDGTTESCSFRTCASLKQIEAWEPNEIAPFKTNEIAPPALAKPLEASYKIK